MSHATEIKMGYEPALHDLLNSDLTHMAMRSDGVEKSEVQKLTSQAAERLRKNTGWSR